jgi:DNA helicase-2/ATP-dependent DNA helicase PcrA
VAAERVLRDYLHDNATLFDKIEFAEKQIEISLGDGITVTGRIDLVRRIDTGEITIVDLKSSDRAQTEDVTEAQLHVYALGYQDLTGRRPDYVEVYELDERKRKPRSVDDDFIADVKQRTQDAAAALRTGVLPAAPAVKKCVVCDYRGMCTAGTAITGGAHDYGRGDGTGAAPCAAHPVSAEAGLSAALRAAGPP